MLEIAEKRSEKRRTGSEEYMSAWKELQLAMQREDITDEELEEYERAYEQEARRDE